ncbi:1,4-dihydroxy-2-naphthoate octaprenyltransferase [Flavobacteriaceae bacterium]|nr:1,4-dihydroxy-2-naphthoate octaprenyltransferase [Flavobacteriaceae bacterium]MDB2427518.1 1,4-dihydroxy-2-naphthoate octaprenyltransferase [Flavobacteriaceae bacterium]MDB2684928.1 1,4-dihydroxy-2-naphthoate octaprenyltransferase [Flavobacteriaceae bacterium]MDB4256510.1 1,4-dihydroxy-2-naphthoate octaprenyltransferase [Flavobacteriaceae bacterium]MDC0331098.1 1,4-dihydroxy-2-naphthoate octaprenyltransferase [Flavobacteriaceae bacterium]
MIIKNFIKAARLRTLPLSISGIILGGFLAMSDGLFNGVIFSLAILTTIGFQVISNFANDYGDGVKGTDAIRIGEERMVSSGKISPKQMKKAIMISVILTIIFALFLIYESFGLSNFGYSLLFFILGIVSVIAAIKYTVGNLAYGYSGFGDLFVFLFFGLLSVLGSYFLFTKEIYFLLTLPAISIGLLSTAVLNLNNMRDYQNDKKSKKNTIVVKIGLKAAKRYHYNLLLLSFISAVSYVVLTFTKTVQFIFLLAYIPLVIHALFVYNNKEELRLDAELKKVALSTFLFSVLLGLGQVF